MIPTLTINRTVITLPVRPGDEDPAAQRLAATRQLAALASEITERLDEMDELKLGSARDFVRRLAEVGRISDVAFRLAVQMMHGSPAPLQSFAEQADRRGITKQGVHHEMHHAIAKIRNVFPELATEMESMRAAACAHEDPTSNADSIRSSMEGEA